MRSPSRASAAVACLVAALATAGCSTGASRSVAVDPPDGAGELADANRLVASLAASGLVPVAPLEIAQGLLAVLAAFAGARTAATASATSLAPTIDAAASAIHAAASDAAGTATTLAADAARRALDLVRVRADAASIAVARDAAFRLLLTFVAATEGAIRPEATAG